jgi:hypothetical protein
VIEAIDAIQKNRFAGAIGTDDRKDLTLFHLKTYIHQGLDTSEGHMEVIYFKLHFFGDGH